MFSVMIREKDGDVEKLQFEVEEISIGRVQGNDIALPKGNVSKRHARIVQRDNGFVIVDLRSTNGTYVNGRKISAPTIVNLEDKVYIGDYVLQINGDTEDESIEMVQHEPSTDSKEPEEKAPSSIEVADFEDDEGLEIIDITDEEQAGGNTPADPEPTPGTAPTSEGQPYLEAMALLHSEVKADVFQDRSVSAIDLESDWDSLQDAVYALVEKAQQKKRIPDDLSMEDLTSDLLYEFTGLGVIEHFLDRDDVSSIDVNAYDHVFVQTGSSRSAQAKTFSSPEAYLEVIHRMIREHTPFDADNIPSVVCGRLGDSATFRIVMPPTSLSAPALNISLSVGETATIQGLVEAGSMNDEMATYLSARIGEDRASLAVAGSGRYERSYLLNTLTRLINDQERLVVLEGEGNLNLSHNNVVRLDPSDPSAMDAIQALDVNRIVASGLPVNDLAEFMLLSAGAVSGSLLGLYAPSAKQMVSRLQSVLTAQLEAQSTNTVLAAGLEVMLFVVPRENAPPLISRIVELHADEKGKLKVTDIFRYDESKSKATFVRV
jgi:pilus assembly protein CpaF